MDAFEFFTWAEHAIIGSLRHELAHPAARYINGDTNTVDEIQAAIDTLVKAAQAKGQAGSDRDYTGRAGVSAEEFAPAEERRAGAAARVAALRGQKGIPT